MGLETTRRRLEPCTEIRKKYKIFPGQDFGETQVCRGRNRYQEDGKNNEQWLKVGMYKMKYKEKERSMGRDNAREVQLHLDEQQ